MAVEIEELQSSEDEKEEEVAREAEAAAEAAAEEAAAAARAAEELDARKSHPSSWVPSEERLAERNLTAFANHPGCARVLVRTSKRALELKEQGNAAFKAQQYWDAIELYSDALDYAPESEDFLANKAVFLNNRAACFLQLEQLEDVVEDCTDALAHDPRYVKAYMRRAKAHERLEDHDSALADLAKVVEIDPGFRAGVLEHARMEAFVKDKNEKLKDEMMGKLKDLGNTVLGKFGMSLDNFNAVQDPNTGSYSISFGQ